MLNSYWLRIGFSIVVLYLTSIILKVSYLYTQFFLKWELWGCALAVNGLLLVIVYSIAKPKLGQFLSPKQFLWILPSLVIVLGALILGLITNESQSTAEDLLPSILFFVVLIPIVEEGLFRGIFSKGLIGVYGPWIGIYLSSIFFSLMHGMGNQDQSIWLVSFALGPLLLALSCDYIYLQSKHICFSILFHASCNGSAIIFQYLDPKWLDRLSYLYLGN